MSDSIVIRKAETRADKLAVMAISREATGRAQPLEYYQALRFTLSKRRAGQWWLLEVDGQPSVSLMCYSFVFAPNSTSDDRLLGFGLGAVATLTTRRRRGFASRLCAHVADDAASNNRPIGLLFSAIEPALYERLGYQVAPGVDLRCDDLDGLAKSGDRAGLIPFDPCDELDGLTTSYRRGQSGLHLHRDKSAWATSIHDNPRDLFFTPSTVAEAYIRLAKDSESLEIVECSAADQSLVAGMVRSVAKLARGLDLTFVHSWLDVSDVASPWFTDRGRKTTLPMVKGFSDLTGAQFSGADYF